MVFLHKITCGGNSRNSCLSTKTDLQASKISWGYPFKRSVETSVVDPIQIWSAFGNFHIRILNTATDPHKSIPIRILGRGKRLDWLTDINKVLKRFLTFFSKLIMQLYKAWIRSKLGQLSESGSIYNGFGSTALVETTVPFSKAFGINKYNS